MICANSHGENQHCRVDRGTECKDAAGEELQCGIIDESNAGGRYHRQNRGKASRHGINVTFRNENHNTVILIN